jgi:glycosyltransferase involved in cell wall biosynthesis
MPALTICLIVRDEERNLSRCLESTSGLSHELVVVDTGSSDSTAAIARQYGARVIEFDFTRVDFAAARNCAIEHTNSEWILMLDGDETLASETLPMLKTLVDRNENAGYFLERRNRSTDSDACHTDYVVRLFPNCPGYRYRGRVHETIDESILAAGGRLLKTPIRIEHNFVSDRAVRRRKNHWYIEILKEEIAANPSDDNRLDFLAAEYHQLEMFAEATEVAEQIARLRPLDARAHLFAGTYHLLYQPDFQKARADLNHALTLRPGYPEAESFLKLLNQREKKP